MKFDLDATLKLAQQGFQSWKNSPASARAQVLMTAADRLRAQRETFVGLLVTEAKKPLTFARVEVDRAIQTLTWAANEALRFGGEVLRTDTLAGNRAGMGIVQRFARGPILGITPFNFPLNLACHKIAPALATGNSIVIKPSPFTPKITYQLLELFCGILPPGVFQVTLPEDAQMPAFVADARWAMISFTGSDRVGKLIQKQNPFVPHCMELGGNAFCIVAEDVAVADLELIAGRVATSAFGFAGQSCISLQNLAVHQKHWDAFLPLLKSKVEKFAYGDPALEATLCGPVINAQALERIGGQLSAVAPERVTQSQNKNGDAVNLIAPTLVALPGWQSSPLTSLEVFGPVAIAYPFTELSAVIGHIEGGAYGLQAAVFTQNLTTIETLYQKLSVGGLIVNEVPSARLEHQPYGGVKNSGQGREGLRYAMEEMTVPKFLSLSGTIPK